MISADAIDSLLDFSFWLKVYRQLKGGESSAEPVTPSNNAVTTAAEMPGTATTSMQTFRLSRVGEQETTFNQQIQTYPTVEEYVTEVVEDGLKRRPIHKVYLCSQSNNSRVQVLIATNGIAAVKCILSMRKLSMQCFKNDRIIKFVCLTTEQEVQSKAGYVKMADQLVFSPPGANTNNYANVDEIVSQACAAGVDAVWAGWGHASENPRLPEELSRHGISFIGPPANAMFALGDKIASTIIAQTVNIPTIEWSGTGLVAPAPDASSSATEIDIPADLYKKACVVDVEEGIRCLREKNITYPIMIKASEGGGGKGIRKCNSDDEFRINFRRVQTEVPGSPIFLMKCLMNARHIEVQLIADQYGQVVPFFTRDCSIQRRCQKIIEEAPAAIAPKDILRRMQQDAVNLAKKVGYVSAGTVEYMYLPETNRYYFLELNPRLQVEHPCTEMISNINIPAIQLQIAMGVPLHRIVDIRLFFGMDRYGISPLPRDQCRTDTNICVIAARITSEDPADQFRPSSGTVEVLSFQSNQNVWGYFSVAASGKVHEYADSQFGHLFAKGTTRHEAIGNLTCALKELELRATFTSQVNYLVGLLHDEEFEQNKFHTGWLDQRIQRNIQSVPEHPVHVTVAIGATVIGHAKIAEVFSKFQAAIGRGQILPSSELTETFELELVHNNVKYSVLVNRFGQINYLVKLNDAEVCTEVREDGHGTLWVVYADQSYTCHLEEEVERYKVSIGRSLTIFEKENDPSVLRSRNAGKFLQYLIKDGDVVNVGETFAEMESMKMVINLEVKKAGGRLRHVARAGQALFPGTLIARLDDQGDMSNARPREFVQDFDEWKAAEQRRQERRIRLDHRFAQLLASCNDVLDGFAVPQALFEQRKHELINNLFDVMNDKQLPYCLFKVVLNVIECRINRMSAYNRIKELISDETKDFPAGELLDEMHNYLSSLNPAELGLAKQDFESLIRICEKFRYGLEGHKRLVVNDFLNAYLETELYFQDVSYDKGVTNVKEAGSNAQEIVRKVYSHTRIHTKNELLKEIIRRLDYHSIMALQPVLKRVANLFNKETEPLALFIRETLNKIHQHRDYGAICTDVMRKTSESSIQELVSKCSDDVVRVLNDIVANRNDKQVLLHEFFFTQDTTTNSLAVRTFIQNTFYVKDEDIHELPINLKKNAAVFKFELRPNTPLFEHHEATTKKSAVYFLSVLPELDLLRNDRLLSTLKENVQRGARNTFLFVALPRGQNGFSNAATWAEAELRRLGRSLRAEVAKKLDQEDVDLMISRSGHPPLYTNYDFSANEKLEIYRLPEEKVDVSGDNSSCLLFKYNDNGIFRIFARYLVKDVRDIITSSKFSGAPLQDVLHDRLFDVIDNACGDVRVLMHRDAKDRNVIYDCNHLLISLEYDSRVTDTNGFWRAAEKALEDCEHLLIKHRITEVEITYKDTSGLASTTQGPGTMRVIYTNETGAISNIGVYRVVGKDKELVPIREGYNRHAGRRAFDKHRPIGNALVQKKRHQAHKVGTTYVYDYPIIIARAALLLWKQYEKTDPLSFQKVFERLPSTVREGIRNGDSSQCAKAYEMILTGEDAPEVTVLEDPKVQRERAANGKNDRGMVAWLIELCTPSAPGGQKVVVIANDITFQNGSFAMPEHNLYNRAGLYARKHRIPHFFIAANAGARIGYAEAVKKIFGIRYVNGDKPEEGAEGLIIPKNKATPEILSQIDSTVLPSGDYEIDAIIGKERDIGVENLVGSGLIAGESSAAFDEVPTYCMVTGRAVGIGAYVARLLKRVVQVESSHLILTGCQALNSLLGRKIYTSNGQLGGTQIMYENGVSYAKVQSDLEGIVAILEYIEYLPEQILKDDGPREVDTNPRKGGYDVRYIIDPAFVDDKSTDGGLLDRGSFREAMGAWGRTMIVGRGRLQGLHVGVIATGTNTVEFVIPADPAAADSQSRTVYQAGQVWYPDSAYKTAEAIRDFDNEGLPLIMIANMRGFSGGQKDMYDMVLKFGAQIVNALQTYRQPVIVYIPPYGELRGGAWAVLDTSINPTCMTVLADHEARGGVLEPAGMVEIKFRSKDLFALMSREDKEIRELEAKIADESLGKAERAVINTKLNQRRELLTPTFHSAAVAFSDLHDRTQRMLAVGAIHDEVLWKDARNYFFDLLRVKLAEFRMARRYLMEVKSMAAQDIQIRHLKEAVDSVRKHLTERGVAVTTSVAPNKNGVKLNRKFTYTPKALLEYEKSAQFVKEFLEATTGNATEDFCRKLRQTQISPEELRKLDAYLLSLKGQRKTR